MRPTPGGWRARQTLPTPGVSTIGSVQVLPGKHWLSSSQRQKPLSQMLGASHWLPSSQRLPRWIGSIAGQTTPQLLFEPTRISVFWSLSGSPTTGFSYQVQEVRKAE